DDRGFLLRVETERLEQLGPRTVVRPALKSPRKRGHIAVTTFELGVQLPLPFLSPRHSLRHLPRLLGERARVQTARLACVALEDELVVLEARDELDDIDAAFERDVGDGRFGGVVPLEEERELRPEVVEESLS